MVSSEDIAGVFTAAAEPVVWNVLDSCQLMVPVFLIATTVISYARAVLFNRDASINFGPIIKGFLLLLVLLSYQEIVWILHAIPYFFADSIGKTPDLAEAFLELSNPYLARIGEMEGNTWVEKGWETLQDLQHTFFSLDDIIKSLITGKLLTLIRIVMMFLQQILLAFLYIAGPLALVLSILPSFAQSADIWLKGYIGVCFWEFTMRVLDKLAWAYSVLYHELELERELYELSWFDAANIVLIIMYLIVPTLTGYFIRVGSAGGFLGKVGSTTMSSASFAAGKIF